MLIRYITDDLEISTDDPDKENCNEKNLKTLVECKKNYSKI